MDGECCRTWRMENILSKREDSSVNTVTRLRPASPAQLRFDSRQGYEIFLFWKCPDRPWGPPSLLFNGYRRNLLWEYSSRIVKLNLHLHLAPWLRMYGAIPPFQYAFIVGPEKLLWRGSDRRMGNIPLWRASWNATKFMESGRIWKMGDACTSGGKIMLNHNLTDLNIDGRISYFQHEAQGRIRLWGRVN